MQKIHYVLYLNPPRTTFMQDMTEKERKIMQQHVAYWNNFMDKGMVLAFGPVLDPQGGYGLGIVEKVVTVEHFLPGNKSGFKTNGHHFGGRWAQ